MLLKQNIVGLIRIDPDLTGVDPPACAEDSTLGQLLAAFAHCEVLSAETSAEPALLVARGRLSRAAHSAAESFARADLAALVEELDSEYQQLTAATE